MRGAPVLLVVILVGAGSAGCVCTNPKTIPLQATALLGLGGEASPEQVRAAFQAANWSLEDGGKEFAFKRVGDLVYAATWELGNTSVLVTAKGSGVPDEAAAKSLLEPEIAPLVATLTQHGAKPDVQYHGGGKSCAEL